MFVRKTEGQPSPFYVNHYTPESNVENCNGPEVNVFEGNFLNGSTVPPGIERR